MIYACYIAIIIRSLIFTFTLADVSSRARCAMLLIRYAFRCRYFLRAWRDDKRCRQPCIAPLFYAMRCATYAIPARRPRYTKIRGVVIFTARSARHTATYVYAPCLLICLRAFAIRAPASITPPPISTLFHAARPCRRAIIFATPPAASHIDASRPARAPSAASDVVYAQDAYARCATPYAMPCLRLSSMSARLYGDRYADMLRAAISLYAVA